MPHELTTEEVIEQFLSQIWSDIDEWDNAEPSRNPDETASDQRIRMEGLAHSILCLLDGTAGDMPGFRVVPFPSKEDKDYDLEQGENWFPREDGVEEIQNDIAGDLHKRLYAVGRKHGFSR